MVITLSAKEAGNQGNLQNMTGAVVLYISCSDFGSIYDWFEPFPPTTSPTTWRLRSLTKPGGATGCETHPFGCAPLMRFLGRKTCLCRLEERWSQGLLSSLQLTCCRLSRRSLQQSWDSSDTADSVTSLLPQR